MKRWAIILLFVSIKASAVALTFPELIQASITNLQCRAIPYCRYVHLVKVRTVWLFHTNVDTC